ncbi:MAG: hypothetical protein HC866_23115 [Leptolyngbyaceae cyanobacterium RU_5_1]|nr:hypothetical protein [Leptolyngbyaceae cyanobacterium RU_5_1]
MREPQTRGSGMKYMLAGGSVVAYPLAFDPQTWFIVLYEGDEYAGYSFSFRR